MAKTSARVNKVIVLEVDLSSGKVEKQDLDGGMREQYIGGRGINARILYDNVGPETDALSPNNLFILGTGILTGPGIPGATRMSITAKSPLWVYGYSNVGGYLATEIRKAGYDHVVIKGKAEDPVFLWIDNDKVEIRSATHLWGKGVHETNRLIREELGDPKVRVMAIGQAGETMVGVSNSVCDNIRGCGGRPGGVMGSKNLKAIVVRGLGRPHVANKELVHDLSRNLVKRIKAEPFFEIMSNFGAAHSAYFFGQVGTLPMKNMTTSEWEEVEEISPAYIADYFTKTNNAECPGCPLTHHPHWEIKEGPYAGLKGVGCEGGPVFSYCGIVGNSYIPALFKAVTLCNDYGIDVVESAQAIGAAMEWFEKGIITRADLDGMELKWGDHAAIIEMIHRIGRRQGFGALLGEGAVHAAEKIGKGAIDCITHCKGRTSGWMDYRLLRGGYLNEMVSIPACEMKDGWPAAEECVASYGYATPEYKSKMIERYGNLDSIDPLSYKKAQSVIYNQDCSVLMDSVEVCNFVSEWTFQAITMKDIVELFQAVTGLDMGEEDLVKAAVRIRDLERCFWVREGYTRKDDRLDGKITNQAVPDGPQKGEKIDKVKVEKMLDEYYQMRGWDIKTGIPTRKKLLEDGLADVVEDLEKRKIKLT